MKKIIVFFGLCCLTVQTVMAVTPNCHSQDFSFQNKKVTLNSTGNNHYPQIYLFHNISRQSFWLNHPVRHALSAGWVSPIASDRWSAILIGTKDKKFVINCSSMSPGTLQLTYDCQKLLQVCQLQYSSLKADTSGSYWLTENQSKQDLLPALQRRGVRF